MRADRPRCSKHVAEIRRPILVRRCAYGDELEQAVLDTLGRIRRELDASGLRIVLDECVEAGLVDGHFTPLEPLDLAGVDVHADHLVAGVREARSRHQTDIS